MRNKRLFIFEAILTALVFSLAGSLTVAEEQETPEEIILDNKGYKTDRKGPVTLSHLSHIEDYGVACNECHHVYKEGKNVWQEGDPVKKCSECHSPLESKDNVKKLSIAFHKNCKGCHKKAIIEGVSEDAPFKSCYHCHERTP